MPRAGRCSSPERLAARLVGLEVRFSGFQRCRPGEYSCRPASRPLCRLHPGRPGHRPLFSRPRPFFPPLRPARRAAPGPGPLRPWRLRQSARPAPRREPTPSRFAKLAGAANSIGSGARRDLHGGRLGCHQSLFRQSDRQFCSFERRRSTSGRCLGRFCSRLRSRGLGNLGCRQRRGGGICGRRGAGRRSNLRAACCNSASLSLAAARAERASAMRR